jgi:hypothetical protein
MVSLQLAGIPSGRRSPSELAASSLSQRIHYHANRIVIPGACAFFDLFVFLQIQPAVFQAPRQSRHLERSASQIYRTRGLYGAESKSLSRVSRGNPGDDCWHMLLGASRPQTTTEDKKSRKLRPERSEWRDLLFSPPTPILSLVTFFLRHATSGSV